VPRLFFGLELPANLKQQLLRLRVPVTGARWQSRHQLHLTLVFLGQVPAPALPALLAAAAGVRGAPFELEVRGLGTFGPPEQPRNLWAGVVPETPVAELHHRLVTAMGAAGVATESRRFRPHITLARFARPAGSVVPLLAARADTGFGRWPVSEFVLFDSTPGAGGSVYTVRRRFPLMA
jgi:2'-5' RNA ligase